MNASELREMAVAWTKFRFTNCGNKLAWALAAELDPMPLTPEALDAEPGWKRSDGARNVWKHGARYPYVWYCRDDNEWTLVYGGRHVADFVMSLGELRTLVRLHEQREAT